MRPLRTRTDLLAIAAQHAPSKACATAIHENRATVLGGFTPAGGLPTFIVRVVSRRGREWLIGIEVDEAAYRYRIRYIEDVPWAFWDGQIGGRRLIDGDVPNNAAFERMKARRSLCTRTKSST